MPMPQDFKIWRLGHASGDDEVVFSNLSGRANLFEVSKPMPSAAAADHA
jgi:hypothetical protein